MMIKIVGNVLFVHIRHYAPHQLGPISKATWGCGQGGVGGGGRVEKKGIEDRIRCLSAEY